MDHFYFIECEEFHIYDDDDETWCIYLFEAEFTPMLNYVADVNKHFDQEKEMELFVAEQNVRGPLTGAPIVQISRIVDLVNASKGQRVQFVGVISSLRTQLTMRKEKMAFATLSDDSGSVNLLIWPDIFLPTSHLLESIESLIITGKVDGNDIIVDEVKPARAST